MGRKMSEEGETDLLPFYQKVLSFGTIVILQPWFNIDFIIKRWKHYPEIFNAINMISNFSKSLIQGKIDEINSNKIADLEENSKKKSIFINQTLSMVQKNEFNWREVEAESNVMIFGAFETTASVLYSVLMCLSFYPEYQEKVYEEIMSVIPEDGDINYEHIKDLSYMEMVINETLRILPAVPLVGRRVAEDMNLGKLHVPKGLK
uniref:Cytochrome P450 n=1 Tax=Megaselia scalaris TaxID=36166 RepID=T1H223_MEGSC